MKPLYNFLVLFSVFIILQPTLICQEMYYEMPYIIEDDVVKCKRLVVGFNENVIPTISGVTTVDTILYPIQNSDIKILLQQLSERYGSATIIKSVPRLVWGDTLIVNKSTGKISVGPDMSQCFRIDFPSPVPMDSVLSLFRAIPVVEYAEYPIIISPTVSPNDFHFQSGDQWYLHNTGQSGGTSDADIDAPEAWDITKGSSSIVVKFIDSKGMMNLNDHEDLEGKFLGGHINNGNLHSSNVAGVIAANTDINEIGIASLGWNTRLHPFHFFNNGNEIFTLENLIDQASAGPDVDIINFSLNIFGNECDYPRNCPTDYLSIRRAIERSVLGGNILIAAADNGIKAWCSDPCGGVLPYDAYPASYDGVIAVTATNNEDNFRELYNYGLWVDISAPGVDILTTGLPPNLYTIESGTSFSAPLVSALAALILSINDFSATEVEEMIKNGAEKEGQYQYDQNGWNQYMGYGRINAYNSLIDAVTRTANENKSTDQVATGLNNGRRLVKDQDGDYHLVFTSGNNIFYRKSTDNGNSWSSSVHLSTDYGQNKFPSIATHENFLFVTWQQYNGIESSQHKYTIKGKWKNLLDTNWKTSQITTPLVWFASETDPIPVVLAADNVDNNYQSTQSAPEVMIAFRKSDGIYHTNLFYVEPSGEGTLERSYEQRGPIHKIPITISGFANPSLTINNAGKIMLTCNSSWLLYAFTSIGSSWSAFPSSIFNVGGVIYPKYSSVTIDGLDDFQISWEGYNYTYGADEILHKKILSNGGTGTPITEFRYSGPNKDSHQPSTFGHIDGNGGVSIYWFTEDNEITRVNNDGTGWDYSGFVFFPYIQTDASYVNSISKDNPNNYAYCWTSTGESPYNYYTSIYNGIPGGGDDPIVMGNDSSITYRSAEFRNEELDVVLTLSLGNFVLIDDEENRFPLNIDKLDGNFTFQKFKDILETVMSDTIPNSSSINSIAFDYAVTTKNIFKIKAGNSNNVKMKFILKNRGNGNTHFNSEDFILSEDSSLSSLSGTFEIPLNELNQNNYLSVKLKLTGIKQSYLNQSEDINLINTYLYGSQSLGKGSGNSNQVLTKQIDFELEQNYPNPFNPVTIINFTVPKSTNVSLIVYDVLGREIKTLVNGFRNAGSYEVDFDASKFPSGVYFYKLQTGNYLQTRKMILIK